MLMASNGERPAVVNGTVATAGYRLRHALLRWHRLAGLAAAPLVLLLVVTGVLAGHANRLGLDRASPDLAWLNAWYGLASESDPVAYRVEDDWLIWLDGAIYFNASPANERMGRPLGVAAANGLVVVGARDELLVFRRDGALVEKLTGATLPGGGPIQGLAADPNAGLVLRRGDRTFAADADVIDWRDTAATPDWSMPEEPPEALLASVEAAHRGAGPTWERVLLDLHSGRLLGRAGPFIMDVAAILLGLLALSGLYNALRRT